MQQRNPARFQPADGDSPNGMLRAYFEKVRFRKNKRQAALSRDVWLDESYLSRLISGEPSHSSRDALILLGAWGWNWQSMSSTSS